MSKLQRRVLRLFLSFRTRPPTVLGLLWMNRWVYALTALLFTALAYLLYSVAGETASSYVGVAFLVTVLRDIGHFRRTVTLWPLNHAIIDWEKVARLDQASAEPLPPIF